MNLPKYFLASTLCTKAVINYLCCWHETYPLLDCIVDEDVDGVINIGSLIVEGFKISPDSSIISESIDAGSSDGEMPYFNLQLILLVTHSFHLNLLVKEIL